MKIESCPKCGKKIEMQVALYASCNALYRYGCECYAGYAASEFVAKMAFNRWARRERRRMKKEADA
jgi:hypothetical protein